MSTPVPQAEAPAAATLALAGDRGPRLVPAAREKPVNAHVLFFVLGYSGLVLIWAGEWLAGFLGGEYRAFQAIGMLLTGLGGFGVVIHTLWKPNERKVRHLLLALAALALTGASLPLVQRLAREMSAAAAVVRLQPLTGALEHDTRIHRIGFSRFRVTINGYYGPETGTGSLDGKRDASTLPEALARYGISPSECQVYRRMMERAGVGTASRTRATLAFDARGPHDAMLVYVLPGHAPPPPGYALTEDDIRWYTEPLGGSWYMARRGERNGSREGRRN
ncbi:MAG TPA: hypothetical protein VHG93_02650 [Longimicrobium sp.]|nr:hypothetical protein [Longimicrobium sp.]